jgi:hypothetical protein
MLKVLELSELFKPNRIEFRVRIKFESFTVIINQLFNFIDDILTLIYYFFLCRAL